MARRLAVLAALLVVLARPGIAQAETDILGGFTSGVSDFVSPSNEQVIVTPEHDFIDEYKPVVKEVESTELEGDAGYTSVIDSILTIPAFSNNVSWIQYARIVLNNNNFPVVPTAVLLVFFWWGLRKAIRVIMAAWRKGHASV